MKKQFLTATVIGAVAIGSMVAIGEAEAATLVTNGAGKVTDLNGLLVGSTTYDIKFENANFNSLFDISGSPKPAPTFWGNQTGAEVAADAINSFLNTNSVAATAFLGNAVGYLIPFASGSGNNITSIYSTGTPWSRAVANFAQNGGGNQPVYAVFSQVPSTAIPTPALLPGLIGMGVATLRKKKKAQEA
jgi:hypothetical protein